MDAPPVQYLKTSDGHNIAYGIRGEGMPLVRVPSVYGYFSLQWNSGVLAHEFDALSEHFRLVLFDARGQGASSRGLSDPTTVDDYVRDLETLVDHLGLERFILLGISATAKIAVHYAVRHPDRITALVLEQYRDMYRGARLGLYEMARVDWQLQIQTSARLGWPWADPETVVSVLQEAITQEDFLRQYLALSADSGDEILEPLEVPTLVMATRGRARPVSGEQDAQRIAALIPGAQFVLFDDVKGGYGAEAGSVPPAILAIQHLLNESADDPTPQASSLVRANLSAREIEVLRLIAAGRSNAQIAATLVISPHTVGRHISNIFVKIGVANRAEAATYALRNGLA